MNNYEKEALERWGRHPGFPELYQSVVTISEVSSGEKVWKIGIYLDGDEF